MPPQPELIAETIDLIAFIVRTPEGRRVTELVRVEGYDAREGFRLAPVEVNHERLRRQFEVAKGV